MVKTAKILRISYELIAVDPFGAKFFEVNCVKIFEILYKNLIVNHKAFSRDVRQKKRKRPSKSIKEAKIRFFRCANKIF